MYTRTSLHYKFIEEQVKITSSTKSTAMLTAMLYSKHKKEGEFDLYLSDNQLSGPGGNRTHI